MTDTPARDYTDLPTECLRDDLEDATRVMLWCQNLLHMGIETHPSDGKTPVRVTLQLMAEIVQKIVHELARREALN